MSLTVTVTRGYTMVAGVKPSVDDWNAGFLPSITVSGSVGASDIADDSITFAMLNPNVFLGGTTATSISSADLIPFGDASVGDNRVITFQNFLKSIALECTARTSFNAFSGDTVLYWEADDTLPVTMTIARFFEQAMVQPYDLAATSIDDTVMVRDDSEKAGAQVKKVRLDNLLPDIVKPGTVNNPTQLVINAKGLVTGFSNTEGAIVATSAELTLPTTAGTAGDELVWAHGLTGTPMEVHVWLKCTDAGGDAGYAENDVIDSRSVRFDEDAQEDRGSPYVVLVDATNIIVIQPVGTSGINVTKKDDGTPTTLTPTKWKAIIRARL